MNLTRIIPGIFFLLLILTGCEDSEITAENYYLTVSKVGLYEGQNPRQFLEAEGQYRENFWGDKFKITVEISNNAKIAKFKDAQVRVAYYSKTKSILGTKDYTIYEILPAQQITKINMEIDNYDDVDSIGLEVIDATAQI